MSPKRQKREKKKEKKVKSVDAEFLKGTLSVARAGFGFVKPLEGDGMEIFVPQRYMGDAIDGDTVELSFLKERMPRSAFKTPAARIESVIARGRNTVVGELIAGNKIRPLAGSLTEDIPVKGDLKNAEKGDWIEVSLPPPGKKGSKKFSGNFESLIGKVGNLKDDLDAIAREYKLKEPYSQEEQERALKLKHVETDRKDFTNHFVMTIDPADAKDFDDAVSIEIKGGTAVLGVHIADIAAWILPGSEFDIKAESRGFTSYLPGKTMPMLPKSFTRIASLNEGQLSFASSVFITVDLKTGEVLSSERHRTLIKVKMRLTFDEVQNYIDGKCPEAWTPELRANLDSAISLTRKMREHRKKTEHYLELSTTHARVVFDKAESEVIGLRIEKQREAEQLVEDCMLAANVEVAKELARRGIPGLFRVHPEPDQEKILEFTEFIRATFGFSPGDLKSRIACNRFLGNLPDDRSKPIITDSFLRSLPRASYLEKPAEHFGLGKGHYSHFTSPIRRYPDLAVHQQLLAADRNMKLRSKQDFARIAAECSAKEENNDQAYFAANDRMKLHYLRKILMQGEREPFEGIIQKVSGGGMLVNVPELGLSGFVPIERLGGSFRRQAGKLTAKSGHQDFKCGDYIYLHVDNIDMVRGSVLFRPA